MHNKIIVLEGSDGSGKTSTAFQLKCNLTFELQSHKRKTQVQLLREPGSSDSGEKIRSVLKTHPEISEFSKLMLYVASRTNFIHDNILKNKTDDILIIDRFLESSFVFQKDVGYDTIKNVHLEMFKSLNLKKPLEYLCIFLNVSPEVVQTRLLKRTDNDVNDLTDLKGIKSRSNDYKNVIKKLTSDKELLKFIRPTYVQFDVLKETEDSKIGYNIFQDHVKQFCDL